VKKEKENGVQYKSKRRHTKEGVLGAAEDSWSEGGKRRETEGKGGKEKGKGASAKASHEFR